MTTKARSIGARSVDRFLDAVVAGAGVPVELFAGLLAALAAGDDDDC